MIMMVILLVSTYSTLINMSRTPYHAQKKVLLHVLLKSSFKSTWRMKSAFQPVMSPFIQQVWLRSKERTGQYRFDDHATSSS